MEGFGFEKGDMALLSLDLEAGEKFIVASKKKKNETKLNQSATTSSTNNNATSQNKPLPTDSTKTSLSKAAPTPSDATSATNSEMNSNPKNSKSMNIPMEEMSMSELRAALPKGSAAMMGLNATRIAGREREMERLRREREQLTSMYYDCMRDGAEVEVLQTFPEFKVRLTGKPPRFLLQALIENDLRFRPQRSSHQQGSPNDDGNHRNNNTQNNRSLEEERRVAKSSVGVSARSQMLNEMHGGDSQPEVPLWRLDMLGNKNSFKRQLSALKVLVTPLEKEKMDENANDLGLRSVLGTTDFLALQTGNVDLSSRSGNSTHNRVSLKKVQQQQQQQRTSEYNSQKKKQSSRTTTSMESENNRSTKLSIKQKDGKLKGGVLKLSAGLGMKNVSVASG
eukprot:g3095.t1